MRPRRWGGWWLEAVLWAALPVSAEVPHTSAVAMGPAGIYRLALQADAGVAVARAQWVVAREQLEQAQAALRPQVSFSLSRHTNRLDRQQPHGAGQEEVFSSYYSQSQVLQMRQTLYRKPQRLAVDMALQQEADARSMHEAEVQKLGVRVVEAYAAVQLAWEDRWLVSELVQHAQTGLDAAHKRFEAGLGVRTDVDEARARLLQWQAQRLQTQLAWEAALARLAALARQPVRAIVPLTLDAVPLKEWSRAGLPEWTHRVHVGHKELQAWAARVQAAQAAVERAQAGHLPTVDLVAQWVRGASDTVTAPDTRYTQRQVGVQLNVPLYSGGALQSGVRQALAELERVRAGREVLAQEVQIQLERDWGTLAAGPALMQALQASVEAARAVEVSVSRSFEGGVRTTLDVLQARQSRGRAQRDLSQGLLQWWTAAVRLLALEGRLDETTLADMDAWTRSDHLFGLAQPAASH